MTVQFYKIDNNFSYNMSECDLLFDCIDSAIITKDWGYFGKMEERPFTRKNYNCGFWEGLFHPDRKIKTGFEDVEILEVAFILTIYRHSATTTVFFKENDLDEVKKIISEALV